MYDNDNLPVTTASRLRQRTSSELRQTNGSGSPMAPSDTTMRKLWLWMAVSYGAKWSAASGETFGEAGPTGSFWQRGLTGITASQIDAGMLACTMRPEEWPPSVQEFRTLCLPKIDHSQDWKANKADPRKKPSAERLAWHQANIEWIKAGNELPRPGSIEPPAPAGSPDFWEIYNRAFQS